MSRFALGRSSHSRLRLGRCRPDHDQVFRRQRRRRDSRRVRRAPRRAANRSAVERRDAGHQPQPVLRQLQHLEKRNHARLEQAQSARTRQAPGAVGRYHRREFHAQGDAQLGTRLRKSARAAPRPDHALDLHAGADRTERAVSRLRPADGRAVGLLLHLRLRPGLVHAAVRRVHRFHRAAIFRVRAARRARLSTPHRQGPVHRHVAVRGRDAESRARADRLPRDRPSARSARQRVRALRSARRLPMRRRGRQRAMDRDRRRERRSVARDAHRARRRFHRPALCDCASAHRERRGDRSSSSAR